jgi:hypothetical protein
VISQLPVDEQLDAFHEVLSRNEVLTEVLSRSASLGLPGWYLTAGCLFQTVWNAVTSRAPGAGIKDYDLFNLIVRPNPVLAPRTVYETKASRFLRQWPELTVLPWPTAATPPS